MTPATVFAAAVCPTPVVMAACPEWVAWHDQLFTGNQTVVFLPYAAAVFSGASVGFVIEFVLNRFRAGRPVQGALGAIAAIGIGVALPPKSTAFAHFPIWSTVGVLVTLCWLELSVARARTASRSE